jgi:hypothetical protein
MARATAKLTPNARLTATAARGEAPASVAAWPIPAPDGEAAGHLLSVARMIAQSPALRGREREIFARYTASLAALLAQETGCTPLDTRPQVVAAALVGLHAALIGYVSLRLADGPADLAQLGRDVQAEGRRALQVLDDGLAAYAPKQPSRA